MIEVSFIFNIFRLFFEIMKTNMCEDVLYLKIYVINLMIECLRNSTYDSAFEIFVCLLKHFRDTLKFRYKVSHLHTQRYQSHKGLIHNRSHALKNTTHFLRRISLFVCLYDLMLFFFRGRSIHEMYL